MPSKRHRCTSLDALQPLMCFICKTIFSQNRPTAPVAAIIVLFNLIHLKCVHVLFTCFFFSMRLSQCLFMWIIVPIVVIIMMMMMMHHQWTCIVIEINWGTIFNVLTFYPLSIWVSIEIGSLSERFVRFQFDFHFHRNRNLPTLTIHAFIQCSNDPKHNRINRKTKLVLRTSRHSSHANRAILLFLAQRIHSSLFCFLHPLFASFSQRQCIFLCVPAFNLWAYIYAYIFVHLVNLVKRKCIAKRM